MFEQHVAHGSSLANSKQHSKLEGIVQHRKHLLATRSLWMLASSFVEALGVTARLMATTASRLRPQVEREKRMAGCGHSTA